MNPDNPILQTKLRPPYTRAQRVARPRLQERVAEGLRGPLTLVNAPAGFGKSTLLAECTAASGLPVAWLSLDRADDQPERLLVYLVAALQTADPAVGAQALQLLDGAAQQAPAEAVLTSLINDLDASTVERILVLDDYQAIRSPAVHAALTFLIEHLPPALHLAIASRTDPPFPAARLRARGLVVELRAADLRFTASEAACFLNEVMGLHLDECAVTALEERTEGWIAGLQMAALSMRDRQDVAGFIRSFSGTHRFILDYLLEEVLALQPPETQQFLLQTSILERFTTPLCASVTGWDEPQCSAAIAYLEHANLFLIPLDDERRWYRYHHLFADLLRARLDQVYPGLAPQLDVRAAAWYEQAGQPIEAVNHALAAGDHARAARLVEENTTRLLARGELSALMGWIGALPGEILLSRPWLCLHQAYALAFAGRLAEAQPLIDQAGRALGDPTAAWADEIEKQSLGGAVSAVRAMVAVMTGQDQPAVELANRALASLPGDRLWDRAAAAWALGYALRSLGQIPAARAAFEEQARLGRAMGNIWTLVTALTDLSLALRAQGQLHQARACIEEALMEAGRQGARSLGYIARTEASLASILYEQNELEEARRLLADAIAHCRLWPNPNHIAFALTLQARVLLAGCDLPGAVGMIAEQACQTAPLTRFNRRMGEVELVRVWLSAPADSAPLAETAHALLSAWQTEIDSAPHPMDETAEITALALARRALAGRQFDEAFALLERVSRSALQAGHVGVRIACLVLTAVARSAAGQAQPALAALGEALALAEPGGYVRVFLDEGAPLRALLAHWSSRVEAAGPHAAYAAHLLARYPPEHPTPQKTLPGGGLVEPLSPREVEVLRLIAAGNTTRQIAARLVVAPGTVKAHTASIFRKLDAANRLEAVARARELGILA